jgi:hypothetical protein
MASIMGDQPTGSMGRKVSERCGHFRCKLSFETAQYRVGFERRWRLSPLARRPAD